MKINDSRNMAEQVNQESWALDESIPVRLYKYLPPRDYVFPVPSLRYTPPSLLNDPNELVPTLDYPIDQLSVIARENGIPISQEGIEQLARDLKAQAPDMGIAHFRKYCEDKHIGILSMASDPLNELMWSHYADSHKGVVLEIDTTHSDFGPQDGFFNFRPVHYASRRPVANLNPSFKEILSWLHTKSKAWMYEQEYRKATLIIDKLKYNGKEGTFKLSPDAITAVYLGLCADDEFYRKARDFCTMHGIPYGRVRTHPVEYKLLIPDFIIPLPKRL